MVYPHARAWIVTAAALGILGFHLAGLDGVAASLFFDPDLHGFPLREEWWLRVVGHTALKWTAVGLWFACIAAGGVWRRGALYMAIIAVAVNLLRDASPYACPWDLPEFGGQASQAGRCLPAAHPLTGFAWFGLYAALREPMPRAAALCLRLAWTVGLAAGAVQVARGAHFVSHVLWSAWISWVLALLLARVGASEQDCDPDQAGER